MRTVSKNGDQWFLRDLSIHLDIRQVDIAEALGISQSSVSNMEWGKYIPNAMKRRKLVAAMEKVIAKRVLKKLGRTICEYDRDGTE